MKQAEFESSSKVISKDYRAICYTSNRHWTGTWRKSYSDAFDDADNHRYGNNGINQFHDVRIVERSYSEAVVPDKK